jgi:hypothetical protein
VADDRHDFLIFLNKSRADLCTPERVAFERALLAWFDDPVGDPPPEPASSQRGVRPVRFTERTKGGTEIFTHVGRRLPVEVWRLEDDVDGVDCTATDGPGASRFATGTMDWTGRTRTDGAGVSRLTRVEGRVVATDGTRYRYLVQYRFVDDGSGQPELTDTIRLRRIR